METSTILIIICALTLYKVMQMSKNIKKENGEEESTEDLKEVVQELTATMSALGISPKKKK